MINEKKLDFWVQNNLNVLITGEYGVGKTAVVEETFRRNGMKLFDVNTFEDSDPNEMFYLYFSAGTMDPYVDLIGVPREQTRDSGNGTKFTYLDLLRPLPLALDRIGAIFMDELNRADAKVRNAVMEIIQFKSINGKKFNNLRIIWGAVNPETKEKTYDVERLDPAQKDRFHIHTEIDFKPDKAFFIKKFGEEQAKVAIDWWTGLAPDMKILCSPRRLDYAISIHNMGGELRDVIDKRLSIKKLEETLKNGLAREKLMRLLEQGKHGEAEEFLAIKNIYQEIEPWFIDGGAEKYTADIFKLINPEFMVKLVSEQRKNTKFLKPLFDQYYDVERINETIGNLVRTTQDKELQTIVSKSIPAMTSKDFGKKAIQFTPTTSANKTFSTLVANYASQKTWQDFAKHDTIIDELQATPQDLSREDATNIVRVMGGLLKQVHQEYLHNNIEPILGPINYACQKLDLDMTKNQQYKFEINKLIKYKLEQHLWVPK